MSSILYVGGLSSAEKGAVGTHTAGVLRALEGFGAEVHAVFLDDQIPDGFQGSTTLVKSAKAPGVVKKVIDRLRLIWQAKRMSADFDYVYMRFDPILSSFIANERTIIEYNDDFLEQIKFAASAGEFSRAGSVLRLSAPYSAIVRLMERRSFEKARLVACVTKGLCHLVAKRAPTADVFLMENGSCATYRPDLDPGHEDNILRLGHVGTLTHWDGLSELFHALAKFVSDCPDRPVHLLVVGHGSMEKELKHLREKLSLQDVVEMRPAVPRDSALQALHGVDAVPLLKTIVGYGLSPIKYYEALCTGRMVLASDVPHINEMEPDEGLVVPFPLRIGDIADGIRTLHMKLSEIRAGVAQRSGRAVARHSWTFRVRGLMHQLEAESAPMRRLRD